MKVDKKMLIPVKYLQIGQDEGVDPNTPFLPLELFDNEEYDIR